MHCSAGTLSSGNGVEAYKPLAGVHRAPTTGMHRLRASTINAYELDWRLHSKMIQGGKNVALPLQRHPQINVLLSTNINNES